MGNVYEVVLLERLPPDLQNHNTNQVYPVMWTDRYRYISIQVMQFQKFCGTK